MRVIGMFVAIVGIFANSAQSAATKDSKYSTKTSTLTLSTHTYFAKAADDIGAGTLFKPNEGGIILAEAKNEKCIVSKLDRSGQRSNPEIKKGAELIVIGQLSESHVNAASPKKTKVASQILYFTEAPQGAVVPNTLYKVVCINDDAKKSAKLASQVKKLFSEQKGKKKEDPSAQAQDEVKSMLLQNVKTALGEAEYSSLLGADASKFPFAATR